MPRPTMHTGKTLIGEVEKELKDSIIASRPFKVPPYRTGDVLDVTMFKSLSEGKFHKFRGIVIGTDKQNSLSKQFKLHVHEADENFSMKLKELSPLVAKIEMHKYGSNKLRNKLNHIHHMDLSKNRVTEPIIKGKNYKSRDKKMESVKEVSPDKEKGKIKRGTTKLEEKYD